MDQKKTNEYLFENYLKTSPMNRSDNVDEWKIKWQKHNIEKFFLGNQKRYLDIGPGHGEVLTLWKRLGYEKIESVDISPDVCRHIQEIGFVCTLVQDTTVFLKNNVEKFDFIMLNDVVEHIPKEELVEFIKAAYGSLNKGGRIFIKVPNAQSPHFATGRYADLTHVQSFTESSLFQLLSVGDFSNIRFIAESYPIEISDIKGLLSKYVITPLYFWWTRKIRSAICHESPQILTQAIMAVAEKK